MAKALRIPPDGPGKLRLIREQAMQTVRDIRWWNAHRTDAEPFDLGNELAIIRLCDRGLRAAEADDGEEYMRVAHELVEVAEAGTRALGEQSA